MLPPRNHRHIVADLKIGHYKSEGEIGRRD